jgi:hypothetical protein
MLKAGTAARRRTVGWTDSQAPEQILESVESLLRAVDERLKGSSADWIGHVKILISGEDESAYGSITAAGDSPRWSGRLTRAMIQAELTVYAAIYGLTDSQVAQAVDGALSDFEF